MKTIVKISPAAFRVLVLRSAFSLVLLPVAEAQTIRISSGTATVQTPLAGRIATQTPTAPDLARALFIAEPLPVVMPVSYPYFGAARAINNRGQILLHRVYADTPGAFVLVTPEGTSTAAGFAAYRHGGRRLNEAGHFVANSQGGAGLTGGIFEFGQDLASLRETVPDAVLHGINDAGGLLGTRPDMATFDQYGSYFGTHFMRKAGTEIALTLPREMERGADLFALNDAGEVVGSGLTQQTDSWWRAVYFDVGQTFRFLPGHGVTDHAVAINRHGQIVGETTIREGWKWDNYAAYWESGRTLSALTLEPTPWVDGRVFEWANDINRWGQVVGHAQIDGFGSPRNTGVLWVNRRRVDLSRSVINPHGLHLGSFNGINDAGEIVGMENRTDTGLAQRTFVMRPVHAQLAVDLNRDGRIKTAMEDPSDEATVSTPFRFWVNDDDDEGDDKRSAADDIPLLVGDSKRDSDNSKVDGIRDLEDFFPVYFDIKQLLTVLAPGTNGISYLLKQEDAALGVVFTSYTRAQAFDHVRGVPAGLDTGFGPALTQNAGDATVTKVTAAGMDISVTSPAFFDRIRNNDGGVLFVEASRATTKPLVLEVRKGADVIAEIVLPLKIDLVETMFRYVNLRSFAHGTPIDSNNQGPGYGSTTPTAAPNDPFASVANRKNMVFVHGYNVNGEGARGAGATAFKRFYWSGSKAKFWAVLWRGDDGQGEGIAPAGATPDYHRNVGHAWQQGPLFRDFLVTLQGDTAIMAHSLGNGVTKVALTRARDPNNPARLILASKPATVKHYFAVDSALPLEATSASDITAESKSRMRHSWWAEYDSQERLWPTHWHELFAGSGDGREGLTWQNVFANLEVGTNFYSSGEEVLANPVSDVMPVWEPLFFAGLRAWIAQEKHKGGNGVAASFFRSWTAGWVENEAWYVPRQPPIPEGVPPTRRRFASEVQDTPAPDGVPSSALPAEPFFQRFQVGESGGFYPGYLGSRLHAPIGDTNADDEARKLVTVAKCLGEAIPALSYPQGSNSATKFDRLSGNFDLNTSSFKNGWPVSRSPNTDWKHSDCLDVSYIFHFKLYDRMKTDGGLQ